MTRLILALVASMPRIRSAKTCNWRYECPCIYFCNHSRDETELSAIKTNFYESVSGNLIVYTGYGAKENHLLFTARYSTIINLLSSTSTRTTINFTKNEIQNNPITRFWKLITVHYCIQKAAQHWNSLTTQKNSIKNKDRPFSAHKQICVINY